MELSEIRKNLDSIDNNIIELLTQRMGLIPKVIEYKQKYNIARYQPDREKELIERLKGIAKEKKVLMSKLLKTLWRLCSNILTGFRRKF